MREEETASSRFRSKKRKDIIGGTFAKFNVIYVARRTDGRITIYQKEKIQSLNQPTNQDVFYIVRALIHYIGVKVRPDTFAATQLIAPGRDPSPKQEFNELGRIIDHLQRT